MTKTLVLLCFTLFSIFCTAQSISRYDVVISEFMADPTPQVGLPNNEWIELRNTSTVAINLFNWRIGDASSQSGPMPNFILLPDSAVIVCTSSAVSAMSPFGKVIAVTSFPSLDNAGDQIYIRSFDGRIIHAIEYNISWYQNSIKADGGWTLEMIDLKNPCSGSSNWKPSIDPSGGTPGRINSVNGNNADASAPQLVRSTIIDSVTIVAVFNEPLDSSIASNAANYKLSNNITILSAHAQPLFFNTVVIKLSTPLQKRIVYTITALNINDCKGNTIGIYNQAPVGIPEDALSMDVVVNEILFNPKPNAFDYVELYNGSNKIFDANKIFIANRNSAGVISSFRILSTTSYLVFPGDHIVVTENAASLRKEFMVENPSKIIELSLPSYPDDKGVVLITNAQGNVVDEVSYSHNWHFALINNKEGIALERIDPSAASNSASNWTSASSTSGFGTPTYKNSQLKQFNQNIATIELSSKIFSPDNDGIDDVAFISYQLDLPGFVGKVTIFDAQGRPVRYLVKNDLLGYKGRWSWDGLDEKKQRLPIGTYVVYTEIYNLQGKRQQFKNSIVLARRLK